MKKNILLPLIFAAILLAAVVPSAAIVNFISIDVNNGNPVYAGTPFTITATGYDPNYNIMQMSAGRNGNYQTLSCIPAHTCQMTWTLSEPNAGQYTYTIGAQNDIGQWSTDAVTVNVLANSQPPATFKFRTAAIDGAAWDNDGQVVYINPSTITVNSASMQGAPFATFDVNPDTRLNVWYNADGYTREGDVFYFDSDLPSCSGNARRFSKQGYNTSCRYIAGDNKYACTVDVPDAGDIDFDFYPNHPTLGPNVISVLNRLFKPNCPIVYGLTQATFVNGNTFTGLDLDDYVDYDNKADLTWSVSGEDNVQVTIGQSNTVSITAIDPLFYGHDTVRFTASNGQCSDSDDLLVNVVAANLGPTVAIDHPQPGDNFTENCGDIIFNATASDPDGTIVSWEWIYDGVSLGNNWNISVPASTFVTGANTVLVRVTDDKGGTASDSVTFNILPHTNPTCMVTDPVFDPNPALYYTYPEGQMIDFAATASPTDTCNVPLFQYFWRDNGIAIVNDQQSFSLDNLTQGTHEITLYVTDGLGGECYDTLFLNITDSNLPPTAAITSPLNGDVFVEDCEQIFFNVTANDADGTIANIMWYWNSNLIYNGQSFTMDASDFGIGTHNVSVTVVDNDGAVFITSVEFDVVDHTNPTLMITLPINDPNPTTYYQFPENTMIDFSATPTATDVCVPAQFQFIWRDNNIDLVTDLQSFSLDNLSLGLHNITVYVTDGFGGEAYDNILLNITDVPNIPPVITAINCYNEFGGPVLTEHDPVFCNVTANDPDGYITIWQWTVLGLTAPYNLGPVFDQTLTIPFPYLDAGDYNVTSLVFDNGTPPATAIASTVITVIPNQAPTVTITDPAADPAPVMEFCAINFSAAANDADGYIVPQWDPAYNWRVSMANGTSMALTTEQNFTYSDILPTGLNTFTVSVTDDDGAQASDSVVVNTTQNIPPTVNISLPVPFSNYTYTHDRTLGPASIDFSAIITDGSQDDCSGCAVSDYSWTWYDTFGGSTTMMANTQSFTYNNPALGIHTITVQTTDCYGDSGLDVIEVNVTEIPNSAPVVTITDPAENDAFVNVCEVVPFNATAVDPENDDIVAWMWTYLGATISSSQSFSMAADQFALGNNTVYAYAFDNQTPPGIGSAARSFNVVDHTGPAVTLQATDVLAAALIINGSQVNETRPIFFEALAATTDSCNADQFNYYWQDNGFFLSNEQNFTLNNLSVGMHMINVIVTDQYGYTGQDTLWINITEVPNLPPVVTITEPLEGQNFVNVCDVIFFNATAVDPENDDISSWMWMYNSNEISGGMQSFSLNADFFNLGNNTVSVFAQDNQTPPGIGTDTVSFNVVDHTGPAVVIDLTDVMLAAPILNGSSVNESRPILFNATATATDVCNADQFNYYWEDNGIFMTTSQSFTRDDLPVGMHMIKVIVTDQYGYTGEDIIWINITDVPNPAPIVSFTCYDLATSSTTLMEYEDIQCNATATDPNGNNLTTWLWDVDGDGVAPEVSLTNETYILPALLGNGTYNVSLTVFDDGDPVASSTVIQEIIVNNNAPAVTLTSDPSPATGTEPLFVNFTCSITPGTGNTPFTYNLSFGNGWTDVVPTGSSQQSTFTMTYNNDGTYNATCYVEDMDGDIGADSIIVTVLESVPIVDFYWVPVSPFENETVDFYDNTTAYDLPLTWAWDFENDGIIDSTSQNASYRYPQDGTYDVNLTVTDSDGDTASLVQQIVVQDTVPENLVIIAIPDPATEIIDNVSFTGFATAYDMPITYEWDFDASNGITVEAAGQAVGHVFMQNGTYIITLTVRDNDLSTASATYTLVVDDTVPTADAGPDQTVYECQSVQFNGSNSTAVETPISYYWDFENDGIIDSTLAEPTYTYPQQGTYTVNLTVEDADGSMDSDIMRVFVLDTAPNAFFSYAPLNPDEGSLVSFDSAGSTLNACDIPHNYSWDFENDGIIDVTGTGPAFATATNTYADQGPYVVNLTITDNDGSSDSYTLTVLVNDVDPVITGLTYGPTPTNEGDTVNFGSTVFSGAPGYDNITLYEWDFENDGIVDQSGAALTNPAFVYGDNGTYTVNLTVTDEDSSVSFSMDVVVDNVAPTAFAGGPYMCNPLGMISLAGSATDPAGVNDPLFHEWDINYTGIPADFNQDYTGTTPLITCPAVEGNYTVGFRVSDDDGGVTIAETSINVTAAPINNPPQFVPPLGIVNVVNNTLFTYDVNATDPDAGDTITYYDDSPLFVIDINTGMISFTPTAIGIINVNITACDDSGFPNNCTSDILGINVIIAPNQDPVADANGPYNGQEGSPVAFNGAGSFDPDGVIVSWSWDFGDGTGTGSGPNPTYTYGDNGTYLVTLTVTDDDGATNSTTTTAFISNVAPAVNTGGPYSGDEGTVILLNGASATDPAGVNDPLTYAWDLDNDLIYETPGQTASFNAVDDTGGPFTVGLRVSDDDSGVTTATATINVNNVAPTADAGGPYACLVGGTAALSGSGSDPAGVNDPLTYAWDLDNDLIYETPGQNAIFNCAAVGTFTVNLEVNDGDSGLGYDSATVVVSTAPDINPPVVTLQLPADGSPDGDGDVQIQYHVADDMAAILTCDIYSNTSGAWQADFTGQLTANDTSNIYTYFGLADGEYVWNVECNDGSNTAFAPADFMFNVSTGAPLPACSDGADNDLDGYTDANDAGCYDAFGVYDPNDNDEINNGATQCSDGADNDLDSFVDWPADPQCTGVLDNNESAAAANIPPTADAGPDQDALEGTVVQLDGSGSDDGGDGPAALSYNWTQLSGPAVTISDIVNPTFTATTAGTYEFQLVVYDGADYSAPDTVTINVYTVQQSLQTAFALYNATGSVVTSVADGDAVYAVLSIDNMYSYTVPNVLSALNPAALSVTGSSDGGLDNNITSTIAPLGAETVWWELDTTGLGGTQPTISVDTEGISDSAQIQIN